VHVATDDGARDAEAWWKDARAAAAPGAVVALGVSCGPALRIAREAAQRAPYPGFFILESSPREAWRLAIKWSERGRPPDLAAAAPDLDPARLVAIAEHAKRDGYVLVEPDLAPFAPIAAAAHAVDRAILATLALGQIGRPVLFVPEAKAPRGLPRLRIDRIARMRVRRRSSLRTIEEAAPLANAALDALDAAGEGGLGAKELLREARDRRAERAKMRGERPPAAGSDDGPALHRILAIHWLHGGVDLLVR
jgi:hypothetical protein